MMKTFHVFYGWLDSDIPKDAEILDKIRADAKAAQDLADAHHKIDADAEEKRRQLHAETGGNKAAAGVSSGPQVPDAKFQPVVVPRRAVFAADPKQVVVPVPVPVIGKKGF